MVELCAGGAAISLQWQRHTAYPPVPWMGSKRDYARLILRVLGRRPGQGLGKPVLLCEPGPWGDAWDLWQRQGVSGSITLLEAWARFDPRELWNRLREAPVPADQGLRVATWLVLQYWNYARMPVIVHEGRWRTQGFNTAIAYNHAYRRGRDQRLPDVIARLRALPPLHQVRVLRCSAEHVEPIRGELVILDPPYDGTEGGYGHGLSRQAVLTIARRWREHGADVCICEATPVEIPGWYHHRLWKPVRRNNLGRFGQEEWLTMSFPVTHAR